MSLRANSAFVPLRNPTFRNYWLTGLSANLGWQIQVVGAAWLMTSISGSPEMIALVQTSFTLPIMLFSLPAGALADAFGRRKVVLWSQGFLLVVSVVLATCAFFGLIGPWLLLGLTFLIGCGKALNNPGWLTKVGEIIPRAELPPAIALNSVGVNIARSIGPAIGGAIVAGIGAFAAFAVNALGNIGVFFVARRWKTEPAEKTLPPEPILAAMGAGIRYVAMSPAILLVMLRTWLFNLAAASVMALMPVIVRDLLNAGPQTFGLLLGAFGFGGVLSAFFVGDLRKRLTQEGLAKLGFVGFAAGATVLALSPVLVLSMAGAALSGASWLVSLSTFNSTVQMSSPRWVVSRCLALYQTMAFGGAALGSWIWGITAGQFGASTALLAAAVVLVLGGLSGLIFPLRELDTEGLDPHATWQEPDVKVDILPQSGPILTTITYRIREEDVPEFLAVIAERRRARARDGARRWVLSRDMLDPELWIERYQLPTWIETIRHHQRRTQASADLYERVRSLHQGDRPEVHYELVRHAGWHAFPHQEFQGDVHHH